jgi:hypothetical protein
MSEHSDVLYDHRIHTHTSCIKEIVNADMVILLIGSRFGGTSVPEALSEVDFDSVIKASTRTDLVKDTDKLSITQVEVMKAIEADIPLNAFVDSKVYADHQLYQKNKAKPFASDIEYPSIERNDTASYIFEFINLITHRFTNNSIVPYANFWDIEDHLLKQWSMLFQRLLREEREKAFEGRKADAIFEQIQDLRAAVLQSIGTTSAREIARSVLRYRRLADFLLALQVFNSEIEVADYHGSFEELLWEFNVINVEYMPGGATSLPRTILLREDDYLRVRVPGRRFAQFYVEWKTFSGLDRETKIAVLEGVADANVPGFSIIEVVPGTYEDTAPEDVARLSADDVLNALGGTPPPTTGGSWTEERVATLKDMWTKGSTATEIANALGGVSRNAVIGKAFRLDLPARLLPEGQE